MNDKAKINPLEPLTEEQKSASVPYYMHEGEMYRLERLNKRWFVCFLIVLGMLFVTNAGWVIYEHQFETYSYEIQQDSGEGGTNTYTGNTVRMVGGNFYGETSDQDQSPSAGTDIQQPVAENLP